MSILLIGNRYHFGVIEVKSTFYNEVKEKVFKSTFKKSYNEVRAKVFKSTFYNEVKEKVFKSTFYNEVKEKVYIFAILFLKVYSKVYLIASNSS